MEIILDIKDCTGCPFCDTSRSYSTDGWDRVSDWICKKMNKPIELCVDWNHAPSIPTWCPVKLENYEKAKN